MNIFNRIPAGFFNLLASNSNAKQNSECFLLIYARFDEEISYKLPRVTIRDVISNYLCDEYPEEFLDGETLLTPEDHANAMLRKFLEAGWLHEESDDVTYEKQLVITDNGLLLAEFLLKLKNPEKTEYSSYILSIHNDLTNKDKWTDNYYVYPLKNVYNNAKQLANSLKKLSTSIKKIIEDISREETLETLTNNLISYCDGSFIREYSRLTKQQNIHMYRAQIRNELEQMCRDNVTYGLLCAGCYTEEGYDRYDGEYGEQLAQEHVYDMIHKTLRFLNDDYDKIMADIKKRIIIYFNLAIGRARFLLNHDTDSRGNVEQYLKYLTENFSPDDNDMLLPDDMDELFNISKQQYIDENSLRYPGKQRRVTEDTVCEVPEMTQADIDASMEKQRKAAHNPYSKEHMKKYVKRLMVNGKVSAADMPVQQKEDILRIVSAAAYSKENGFDLEVKDDYIEVNGFCIHDFTIRNSKEGK